MQIFKNDKIDNIGSVNKKLELEEDVKGEKKEKEKTFATKKLALQKNFEEVIDDTNDGRINN